MDEKRERENERKEERREKRGEERRSFSSSFCLEIVNGSKTFIKLWFNNESIEFTNEIKFKWWRNSTTKCSQCTRTSSNESSKQSFYQIKNSSSLGSSLFFFFCLLNSHWLFFIFQVPHDTKLSKLDTLRLATSYILHLTQILDTEDLSTQTNTTAPPPTMTTTTTTTNSNLSLSAPNNFVNENENFIENCFLLICFRWRVGHIHRVIVRHRCARSTVD